MSADTAPTSAAPIMSPGQPVGTVEVWNTGAGAWRSVEFDSPFGARESSSRFPTPLSGRGRFWGAVVRPVKPGGEKARHGGGRAPSDDLPRVKSQRSDLRKRGDSIRVAQLDDDLDRLASP